MLGHVKLHRDSTIAESSRETAEKLIATSSDPAPVDNYNAAVMDSEPPDDRSRRAASDLSMDDLEAAQALEGLRSGKADHLCHPARSG